MKHLINVTHEAFVAGGWEDEKDFYKMLQLSK